MATSKELRKRLRTHHKMVYGKREVWTPFGRDVLELLDALDAEEKERQAHDPFLRAWDNPSDAVYDDEGEGNGP